MPTNPLPLDAASLAELARKAEAARDTMTYAACRVLDGEMDHEANAIASRAQGEFLHAVSSPAVILALLASVRGAEADTRDAERYRYLLIDAVIAVNEDGETVFVSGLRPMMDADAIEDPEMITRYIDAALAARAHPEDTTDA